MQEWFKKGQGGRGWTVQVDKMVFVAETSAGNDPRSEEPGSRRPFLPITWLVFVPGRSRLSTVATVSLAYTEYNEGDSIIAKMHG